VLLRVAAYAYVYDPAKPVRATCCTHRASRLRFCRHLLSGRKRPRKLQLLQRMRRRPVLVVYMAARSNKNENNSRLLQVLREPHLDARFSRSVVRCGRGVAWDRMRRGTPRERRTLLRLPNPRRRIASAFQAGSGGLNTTSPALRHPSGMVTTTASAEMVSPAHQHQQDMGERIRADMGHTQPR
jgi:hypothetical protein